jgi:uncharacterized Tic20 family protein
LNRLEGLEGNPDMRRQQEQDLAAIGHACNVVPVWGLVLCGLIWFYARERSRYLTAQAQQAMVFHGLLLFMLVVWSLIELFARLIGFLVPLLGDLIKTFNLAVIYAALAGYVIICLVGAWRCWREGSFRYPLIRDRGGS